MAQLPRGLRNNNPLNLIISNNAWLGKCNENTDGHFEQFITMEYGVRAAFINGRTIITRNRPCTMARFISIWAPASENNTAAYIAAVEAKAVIPANRVLDWKNKNEFCRLLWAMAFVENGREVSFQYFENGYSLAFRN